jgi:hypothetical protein
VTAVTARAAKRAAEIRRIADGTLKSTKLVGVRLIEADSVKALFEQGE